MFLDCLVSVEGVLEDKISPSLSGLCMFVHPTETRTRTEDRLGPQDLCLNLRKGFHDGKRELEWKFRRLSRN